MNFQGSALYTVLYVYLSTIHFVYFTDCRYKEPSCKQWDFPPPIFKSWIKQCHPTACYAKWETRPLMPPILMGFSHHTQVSWLSTPFCQPFPTLIHCQRFCTARDAPGLSVFCPGLVNSSRSCTHCPGWLRDSPVGPSWTEAEQVRDSHGVEDCQREHRSDVR